MSVGIQGSGRTMNPRPEVDEDWNWFWFCSECGSESRKTSKERAEQWAPNHHCGASALEAERRGPDDPEWPSYQEPQ